MFIIIIAPVAIKKEAGTINGGEPGVSPRNTKRKV